MIEIQNAIASATGNLRGALDAAGLQLNAAAALPAGYWEFGADTEFYIVVAKGAAVALGTVGAGSRCHEAGTYVRFRSEGDLYCSMKAVAVAGIYRANRYETL